MRNIYWYYTYYYIYVIVYLSPDGDNKVFSPSRALGLALLAPLSNGFIIITRTSQYTHSLIFLLL